MEKDRIIKKVLIRLAYNRDIANLVKEVEQVYKKHTKTKFDDKSFARDIVEHLSNVIQEFDHTQKEKLLILRELKKKGMFDFNKNKHLEKAWRFIAKNWEIPSFRFEGY